VTTVTEETLFAAALEKGTHAERAAFLKEACAGDPVLRRRVEALLESHEQTEFLRTPAVERAAEMLGGAVNDWTTEAGPTSEDESDLALDFLAASEKPGTLGRLGHYEVLEVIGRGGMGIVLRAFDETLQRVVAIKVMAPALATSATARKRFVREAQGAAAIRDEHVIGVYAVESGERLPYLAMEYVAGVSLQQRLDRDGPLQLQEILRIGLQVAAGLAAAHAQGLIHRDIKPSNILLENGVERVRITDFGLARAVDDASLTQSGVIAGTPNYMAPEQARGEAVDQRSDLFSLGSVLYAMCTGRAPFRATGALAVLKRVCEDAPSPIREANPEIPDWLVAIVEKLHAKDPADRFQTAAELAEILGQCLAHVQQPALVPLPPTAKRTSQTRASRQRRWMVLAIVLSCLVAALGVSEATGVTQLTTTVIRIFTPDGTLVVETDDPAVKLTIEGDGGLVITGAGPQEVRLRPGSYKVSATKDGKPVGVDRDLVTITHNDKQVVKVRLEGSTTTAAGKAEPGNFVLLGGNDVPERKFDTLAEAVLSGSAGDTIEVRGDGPFVIDYLQFNFPLTIRAANGARPVFTSDPKRELPFRVFLAVHGPLRLEGLEFRSTSNSFRLLKADAPLYLANCRFQLIDRSAVCIESDRSCMIRNCELVSAWGAALAVRCDSRGPSDVANCIVVGHVNLDEFDIRRGTTIQFRGNSFVSPYTDTFFHALHSTDTPQDQVRSLPGQRVHVAVTENLIASKNGVYCLGQNEEFKPRFEAGDMEQWLPRRVKWDDQRNIYRPGKPYLAGRIRGAGDQRDRKLTLSRGNDFADWNRFWGLEDTGSSEGDIRFVGGDILAKALAEAAQFKSEDFRLRPDSAGYRAGPRGTDLGADVDLVGPGPAYERWKTTPEYKKWLEETGTLK
jgi:hypothetical protein